MSRVKEICDIAYHYIPTDDAKKQLKSIYDTTEYDKIKLKIFYSDNSYKDKDDFYHIKTKDVSFLVKYNEWEQPILYGVSKDE